MDEQYILWGGTGQAKVLHEVLQRRGINVVLVVDNRKISTPLVHIPIVYGASGLDCWLKENYCTRLCGLAAVGGNGGAARLDIMEIFVQRQIRIPCLIHDTALVALDAHVGEGSQILANSVVCTHVRVGRGVIINTSATVDHDCEIGDGVHIAPGVTITGEVHIRDYAFIGAGSVVLPGITIGEKAVVGAGAVVTKDVLPMNTVVGNPARIIG